MIFYFIFVKIMLQSVEAIQCPDDPNLAELTLVTKDGERKSFTLSKQAASSLVKSVQRISVKQHSYLSKLYDDRGAELKDDKLIYYEIYNYPTRKTRMKKTIKLCNLESKLNDLPSAIVQMIADNEDERWSLLADKAKRVLNNESLSEQSEQPQDEVKDEVKNKKCYKKLRDILQQKQKDKDDDAPTYGVILPKIEEDSDGEDVLCLDDDDKQQKLKAIIDI